MSFDAPSPIDGSPTAPPSAPPPTMVQVSYPQVKPVVTYTILSLTVLVFLGQYLSQFMLGADIPAYVGMKANDAILRGELWRLFTPMLLHGSLVHIAFNMYALHIFGPSLEGRFGHWRFLFLYLLGGFAGNVASFIFSPAYSLGSSTAIFGLLGAEMVFSYRNRQLLGARARRVLANVITVAGINLIIGLSPGIDNWGHIGGLVGGTLFTWFGGPLLQLEGVFPSLTVTDRRESSQVLLAAVGVGGFLMMLAGLFIFLRIRGLP